MHGSNIEYSFSMNSNIKQLSVAGQIRLVKDVWDSIATEQNAISLTSEQKVERDKRLDAYEATAYPGRPFEKAIAEIRNKL